MKYPATAIIAITSNTFNTLFSVFIAFFSLPCYNAFMNYVTKEVFTTKRDTSLFSWIAQARDEQRQANEYISCKLGNDYKSEEVYPPKRKKFDCPADCGNTYVWINKICFTPDRQKQILCVQCAHIGCGEIFFVYQEAVHK